MKQQKLLKRIRHAKMTRVETNVAYVIVYVFAPIFEDVRGMLLIFDMIADVIRIEMVL